MTGASQGAGPCCTVAVLVTHRAEISDLATVLQALARQVDGVVLVDNGSGLERQAEISDLLSNGILGRTPKQILFLPKNAGIGEAQNQGIALARSQMGADHILLSDQDSAPALDMVFHLHEALRSLAAESGPVAVVGPDYSESQRGIATVSAPGSAEVIARPAVIASGALIPVAAFDAVGGFEAELFMDFVDTEWCFRARAAGWGCYVSRRAHMAHQIGRPGPRFAGRRMALHSPERMYYQLRNLLLLMRRATVPRGWGMRMLPRYLIRSLYLSLICAPRLQRVRYVGLGVWHGLCGRSGALGA